VYFWLLEYLNCDVLEIFEGKKLGDEIYNGFIRTSRGVFYVQRGVLFFMDKIIYKKYRKIIGAYRQISPFSWLEYRSDWIKHLRYALRKILLDGFMILRPIKKHTDVLALGCGAGWEIWRILSLLNRLGTEYNILGCDIAINALIETKKITRRRNIKNVDVVCCASEDLPFKDSSFDIVTAIFGVLDHSLNFIKAFREISRVLKSGGVLIATVLNKFALDWIFKVIRSPNLLKKTIRHADKTHARIRIPVRGAHVRIPTHFYNVFELRNLTKLYRLKIVKMYGIFSMLFPDFKKKKFSCHHKILSAMEKKMLGCPVINTIGRYIGFIAKKMND